MEEIQNKVTKVEIDNSSIAITKGYGYTNKQGVQRYSYNDVYYVDGDRTCRKHSNEAGDFYYNVDLIDVVIETFPMKDGQVGSKTYPLSETPYLAESAETANEEVMLNFLKFKLHR